MRLLSHVSSTILVFLVISCSVIITAASSSVREQESRHDNIITSQEREAYLTPGKRATTGQSATVTAWRQNNPLQPEVTKPSSKTSKHALSQDLFFEQYVNEHVPMVSETYNNDYANNTNKGLNEKKQTHVYYHNAINRTKRDVNSELPGKTDNDTDPYMQTIKIATVLPADDTRLFSIRRVRPAIEYAIEKMNPMLAELNKTLKVKFRDSNCDIADGINEAINFYVHNEMDVLFGPCCDYAVAPCARQVRYWNIPMITAGAQAGDFGLGKDTVFSTLTRLGSNFNTLVQVFIDILKFYNWQKVNVIYDPHGQTGISRKFCHIAANDIHYGFRDRNFTMTYEKFEQEHEILNNLHEKIGLQCAETIGKMQMSTAV